MKEKLTRTEYEAICAEKGITTMPAGKITSDDAIQNEINSTVWERWSAYAAYSGPGCEEAIAIHSARQLAYFKEKQVREEMGETSTIEKEKSDDVAAHPNTQAAMVKAMGFDPVALGGKIVDGELYKPDANPNERGSCARCGKPGVWIAGAAEILCAKHQDDY